MKTISIARTAATLAALGLITGTAYARPDWVNPVKGMSLTCGFLDPNYTRTPCTAKGRLDPRNSWRQHLGSDFRASVGASVYAPVKGTIVLVDAGASRDPALAYLVLKDAQTGEEHVIGHIFSSLRAGTTVEKGAAIGSVRNQGSNTHVHWGLNVGSVAKAMRHTTKCFRDGQTKNCEWGWGKAPYEATQGEVRAQGWRNVL